MADVEKIIISAVIPAYNAEKYIARSIDSVLAQTRPVDEIIVVDDGSTDGTAAVIKGYGDKARYIHQPNAGVSAARNAGIHAATGDWIAFLDADDEWLPIYLERQVNVLKKNSDLVWSVTNFFTCSCSEQHMAPRAALAKAKGLVHADQTIEDYFVACLNDLQGCTDTVLVRKRTLIETGLFKIGLHKAEDLDLWWRIAHRYPKIGFIVEPLAIYHLGICESGNKRIVHWEHYLKIISEHLILAEKHGRLNSYKPLASKLLCGWMRGMLFNAQGTDIRKLLQEFGDLIPLWYRCLMYGLTMFPRLTRAICLLISKIVRLLHLRRRVVVPPNVAEN